ncbi:MAG: sigma-54-dependent Fis family transcriptional regulator, partial [Bacteroidetes bacterium]|nr:sigma-54-dependent Fis family transcriptional regulator [Bacteroidota bacterium]
MKQKHQLDAHDREFFRILSQYAFRSPFEKKSLELGYIIAEGKYPVGELLTRQVCKRVKSRLSKVTIDGQAGWKKFSGEDQNLIRLATLHDAYYQCFPRFDELIQRQITGNLISPPVTFAEEILALLRRRDFNKKESLRYFSFFYQLRRAWYFINHGLIGQSESMETLRSHLWRSVFTAFPKIYEKVLWNRMDDFSTFLVGETGTGKGTAASAIGRSGFIPFDEQKGRFTESFTKNFIEINLSQFSEALIESELFGHKKGAFTGAVDNHRGIFSLCSSHGSIFLDEIGDVSVPIQIKLLKVLEDRFFTAVGGHDKRQFNGRIITATNKTISELEQKNSFREDFYYRLCSNVINVPTLRQQIYEDPSTLEALLIHTIDKIVGEPVPELLEKVIEILQKEVGSNYDWPGNVRELEQAVRSILLTL